MTTPPPDKQVAVETLEEIATRIVDARFSETMSPHQYGSTRGLLIIDLVQALRNERERCAEIAGSHSTIQPTICDGPDCGTAIARAIREGK